MQIQACRNNRRTFDERPCTHAGYDPSIIICISIYGISEREVSINDVDRHANLKYKFGNRHFWSEGYYVSTVGLNDATVEKYIREQEMHDIAMDKMSVKEYSNPFSEAEQQAYKQEKARRKNK